MADGAFSDSFLEGKSHDAPASTESNLCERSTQVADSKSPLPSRDEPPSEVNIVVTGFSPWGEGTPWPPLPVNTSWLIANALPRVIFRDGKPNIRIITYPKPLFNGWTYIRELVPKLWDGNKELFSLPKGPNESSTFKVHAMLHLGMLDQPNSAFRIERNGFKTGYCLPDVDVKYPSDDDLTGGGAWESLPDKLSTDVDVNSVLEAVKTKCAEPNVLLSDGIHRYLCCYIYWASLAEAYIRKESMRVLFPHTPIEHKSEDIERGVQLATAVIEAVVESVEIRHEAGYEQIERMRDHE